jgi:hypothetical protein
VKVKATFTVTPNPRDNVDRDAVLDTLWDTLTLQNPQLLFGTFELQELS